MFILLTTICSGQNLPKSSMFPENLKYFVLSTGTLSPRLKKKNFGASSINTFQISPKYFILIKGGGGT